MRRIIEWIASEALSVVLTAALALCVIALIINARPQ